MTLAKKSRRHHYKISVYFNDGNEREFDYIDWCKLDLDHNLIIMCSSPDLTYINYSSVSYIDVVQR